MRKFLEFLKSLVRLNFVFHVKTVIHIFVMTTTGTWVSGKTEAPMWAYAIVNGQRLFETDNENCPMFAKLDWSMLGYSAPPRSIVINGYLYIRAYASQGGLKKGTAYYVRSDIWRKIKGKLVMSEPAETVLTEEGQKSGLSIDQVINKIAATKRLAKKLLHKSDILDKQYGAVQRLRASGMSDDTYASAKKNIAEDKGFVRREQDALQKEVERLQGYITKKQIGSRTRQKHDQIIQLNGTGVQLTNIPINVANSMMLDDDARVDSVEGFAEIDAEYEHITPVDKAAFGGMDGCGFLGCNWQSNVTRVVTKMYGKEISNLLVKFLQVRVWKGIMRVMPPVKKMAEDRGVQLTNGGIIIDTPYGERIFKDDSIVFTRSMVKNEKFFDTWEDLVNSLLVPEIGATSFHFTYNKVKMNRQFFELLMAVATDEEIAAVVKSTAEECIQAGTGAGYIKEALLSVPEWINLKSMRDAVLHPGLSMTLNKKMFNKSHRAAAGKVSVWGDCLVAQPDSTYSEDILFAHYGFFENEGRNSGSLRKRILEDGTVAWEVRVPHATERGLIGHVSVLARPPYVTPYPAVVIVVGDAYSDGVIEIPMCEGCPIMTILACDFDGDHIYIFYDVNIVNAAIRMLNLVVACGGYIVTFADMPSNERIKVCDQDEYMVEAMNLCDVGLATSPIFRLCAMLPTDATPDMLVNTCVKGEQIRVRDIIWGMMMVNAAVTRAADAIKRGAPNGFNDTKSGQTLGDWCRGTEMSRINDHCEQLLGIHFEDTMNAMSEKEENDKIGFIDWTNSACDRCRWIVGKMIAGDTELLTLDRVTDYISIQIENGGWITKPERHIDWQGYPWRRWTTINPSDTNLDIDIRNLGDNVYVDLDGKKYVSAEEAVEMWTRGVECNLDGEVNISLIYSRLFRNWEKVGKSASDWKRKVSIDRAKKVCLSIIKAWYVNEYGLDDTDLNKYAMIVLYNNLGAYFMSESVTGTTADELRNWSSDEDFYALMKEASEAWEQSEKTEEDEELDRIINRFKSRITNVEELHIAIAEAREAMGDDSELEFVGNIDTSDAESEHASAADFLRMAMEAEVEEEEE